MYDILPGLILGSVMSTKNKQLMQQKGVTHILSLGERPVQVPDNGVTKFFDIKDDDDADLLSILPEIVEFIGSAITGGGKIIVHCFAGTSRSASCCIAYVMASQSLDYEAAHDVVHQQCRSICPNFVFQRQLN